MFKIILSCVFVLFLLNIAEARARARSIGDDGSTAIRSDLIETRFKDDREDFTDIQAQSKPGWMCRQLLRFGDITSHVGSQLGGTAAKVTTVIEKLCKMLKAVIPIVAAVCKVGQFKFCQSADAPMELAEAMQQADPLNLQVQD